LTRHRLFYFLCFGVTNALVAYTALGVTAKVWAILIGILLPLVVAWHTLPDAPNPSSSDQWDQPRFVKTWIWVAMLSALILRLFKLTSLFSWPRVDDGHTGFIAIQLANHWSWDVFNLSSQAPGLYYWAMGLWFKIFTPSLTTLWLFPALVSTGITAIVYQSCRRFLPVQSAVLAAILWACGFWPLYLARFSQNPTAMLLFEWLLLGMVATYTTRIPSARMKTAAALGFVTGIGFYTYTPWVGVALAAFLWIIWHSLNEPSKDCKSFGVFILCGILVFSPYLFSAYSHHYGSYIASLWVGPQFFQAAYWQKPLPLSYLSGLFWGPLESSEYGPEWGGLFNPIWSSAFLIGLFDALRNRGPYNLFLALCLPLFLLPGTLSNSVEFTRIAAVLPVVLIFTVQGFQNCRPKGKWSGHVFLAFFLAFSLALDAYHLLSRCPQAWAHPNERWTDNIKSVEFYKAYSILQKESKANGPGVIFLNFTNNMDDQTLTTACYSFNKSDNSRLFSKDVSWGAVLTNIHYQPFLNPKLPDSKWIWLSRDLNRADGGLVLGLFRLNKTDPGMISDWLVANRMWKKVAYSFIQRPTGTLYEGVMENLSRSSAQITGDAFLRSVYWEKAYYLHLQDSLYGSKDKRRNLKQAFLNLQSAIQQGYPAAHLWNELGSVYLAAGNLSEARLAFQQAMKAPINQTPAAENLLSLGKQ
jgi:4-amino-4-deoxy-L-arabinose transferase-like glycosyltransferase